MVYFGIALMDNSGGKAHWTQGSVLNKLGVGITVDVEQIAQSIPGRLVLHQNYPNPFNPSTVIRFELPTPTQVRLSVYDLMGREVSVLVNQRRDAGVHQVQFDGSNFASGVYFYRIEAGSFLQTRKLLILR
jgi:hypothetical protein